MADLQNLIREYLAQTNTMQLATSVDDHPWACTIHYYTDEELNFYWISTEAREHSQYIQQNPNVAAAVLVHENTPDEPYVVGISVAGTAELLGQEVPERIGQDYLRKHSRPQSLLDDIASGQNDHRFYCLKPTRIVLFDSKNFPHNPRQEWRQDG
jgi:uncharacterized protein YhbP (UPF0306 family)